MPSSAFRGNEAKRQQLRAEIALRRIKQSNDAVDKIIEILRELPDWQARKNTIDYLHRQFQQIENDDAA